MKQVALGTAVWGWTVDKPTSFSLLENFYSRGFRYIDTARNYPINGNYGDFRKASSFLSEWIRSNRIDDLKIIYKIGSVTNKKVCDSDLGVDGIKQQTLDAKELFGSNLDCVMVHWDDRNDVGLVNETCQALKKEQIESGLKIGLSGISCVDLYYSQLHECAKNVYIEGKSNFTQNDENRYQQFIDAGSSFWAYGIALGGLKLDKSEYVSSSYVSVARSVDYHDSVMSDKIVLRIEELKAEFPMIKSLYHASIVLSEINQYLYGYIIGPSSLEQLDDFFSFRADLSFDA